MYEEGEEEGEEEEEEGILRLNGRVTTYQKRWGGMVLNRMMERERETQVSPFFLHNSFSNLSLTTELRAG